MKHEIQRLGGGQRDAGGVIPVPIPSVNAAGKEGVDVCCSGTSTRGFDFGFRLDLVYQLFHDFHADELLVLYDSGTGARLDSGVCYY